MTNKNYTKPKVMITETRTYKLWESAGRKIVEAQLTPDQIKQIFQGAQDIETGGGNNRTMIGKGKDAATAVGQAWEKLKTKAQTSKPIDGFEKKYDAVALRLKQATGGDQGAMKYVQKYRDFAKKHPIAQGVIYAALIAAIGLSGAGVGGAAALGLFKMTDKLLQGEKFTSAAWSGAKTGALAYGASQLAQYFQKPNVPLPDNIESVKLPSGTDYIVKQGDTLSQIAEKYGVSVEELMKANNGATTVTPTGQSMTWDDPNALSNVNAMGDATPSGTGVQQDYDVKTAPKVSNPDRINVGQKLNIPGATGSSPYQGGVGTAADTWDKIGAGKYPYDQISANQAAKYGIDTGGLGDASKAGGKIASDAAGPSQSMIDQMRNQNLFKMQDQADAAFYADKPDDFGINPRNNDAVGTGMPGSANTTVPAQPAGASYNPDYLNKVINGEIPRPKISAEKAQAALDWQSQNGGQVPSAAPSVMNGDGPGGFSKEYLQKAADPDRVGRYMISPEKAQELLSQTKSTASNTVSGTLSGVTGDQMASNPAYKAIIQKFGDTPGARQAAMAAAKAAILKGQVNESVQLTESQIFLLIGKIVERQRKLDEGIMDTLKGAAGKTANWARTKGQNLTTKITADKLLQAWKKAQSPTDSDAVAKVMIDAGVPQETVTNLMKNFIQGPSAGTNTNVWQGADRSVPAYQRKQQGQSFAATPNASGQTPTPQDQTPAPAPQGKTPTPQGQTPAPAKGNLPLRYYGAGNKSPTDFWGRKRPVEPTMQSQQQQEKLAAANAAATTSATPTTPTTPQGTTYDPSNAAANKLAKGQADQKQALQQMAATQRANSPASQQNSAIKAAATAAMAKPGFQQTAADKLAIKQAAANNIIQMPKNTTTPPIKKVGTNESEFAGQYATGVAGQWRNKGPKANKPATIGDLVGESEENKNNNKEDRFSRFMDRKYKKSEEVGRVNNPPIKGTPNTAKTGYYPTPKPLVKKLDTPLANETVAEGSEDLARILHIAGIRK